jgi:hypothetical protein
MGTRYRGLGFWNTSIPALRPNQSAFHRARRGSYFLGVKRPMCVVKHSPRTTFDVKNEWSYTSTPTLSLRSFQRGNYTCTFTLQRNTTGRGSEYINHCKHVLKKTLFWKVMNVGTTQNYLSDKVCSFFVNKRKQYWAKYQIQNVTHFCAQPITLRLATPNKQL